MTNDREGAGVARDGATANDDADIEIRIVRFLERAAAQIARATSFESAAQRFVTALYTEFQDIVVLSRVFAVIPYGKLEAGEREFVRTSVSGAAASSLHDELPVMTLFGTHGIDHQWNDRTNSRDHRAIALLSDAFVEDAPMLAKLFAELGGGPDARHGDDWQLVNATSDGHGLFFVGDARTTTDPRGRRVIPSEDFVERYGVRTVFGFGGRTANDEMTVIAIVFCRRTLMRSFAKYFVRAIDVLRDGARDHVARGILFEPGHARTKSP